MHTLRPLDSGPIDVSFLRSFLQLALLAAPAYLLLALAMLLGLRRVLGHMFGSTLWICLAVTLHSQFWLSAQSTSYPLTLAHFVSIAIGQLTNPDLLQQDQVFGPLSSLLWGSWSLCLCAIWLMGRLRPVQFGTLSPLNLGLFAGTTAACLQAVNGMRLWQADPSITQPADVHLLFSSFCSVSLLVWLVVVADVTRPPSADLRTNLRSLLPAAIALVFATLPLQWSGENSFSQILIIGVINIILFFLILNSAFLIHRVLTSARNFSGWNWAGDLLTAVGSIPVLFLFGLLDRTTPTHPVSLLILQGLGSQESLFPTLILLAGMTTASACLFWLSIPHRPYLHRGKPQEADVKEMRPGRR
jgi:hypothetical protein